MTYPTQLLNAAQKEKEKRKAARKAQAGKQNKHQQRPGTRLQEESEDEEKTWDEEDQEEGVKWTERGIPNFAETDAHERRHRRPAVRGASLSKIALEKMPSLDDFISALDPKTGRVPLKMFVLTCFDMSFPPAAVKLFAEKVGLGLSIFFHPRGFVALLVGTYMHHR